MDQPQSSLSSEFVVDAVYKDGAIQPIAVLPLPEDTPLHLRLATPITALISLAASPDANAHDAMPRDEQAIMPAALPVRLPPVIVPQSNHVAELRYLPPLRLTLVVLALFCGYATHTMAGEQALTPHLWLAVLLWIGGIGAAAAACFPRARATPTAIAEPAWSRAEMAGVGGLFVLALLVRLLGNGSIPAALTGDEGSIGLTAADIVAGRFNNPFVTGWFSFPSLFFNVPALSIAVFGQNYAALRAPAAVVGACTVLATYWFGRVLFNRTVAFAGAALLAALHFHIHFSRVGLNNIWDGLFGVLVLGTFWRGWHSGRRGYFIASGMLLGLSQYFYTSTRVVPLVFAAWLLLMLFVDRRLFAQRVPGVACLVFMALVVVLPLGLFFVNHPDDFGAPVSRVSLLHRPAPDAPNWFERTSQQTGTPEWRLLLENYQTAVLGFVQVPLRSWYASGSPLLLILPAVFFCFGTVLLLLNLRDPRSWLLLLMILGVAAISALTESTPAAQRYVIAAPIATLIAGVGFGTLLRQAVQRWPTHQRMLRGLAGSVLALAMAVDLQFYFLDYAPVNGHGDPNTWVATQLSVRLEAYQPGTQVFFFGLPRMGYRSVATVPFLAPQVEGTDVADPLTTTPDWPLRGGSTVFVFLPERQNEAALVAQQYAGGRATWVYDVDGKPLYYAYEVVR